MVFGKKTYTEDRNHFWRGKRVLITGHSGFKGAWLSLWLQKLGAEVSGVALTPASKPSLYLELRLANCMNSYICDIRDREKLSSHVKSINPEIVFHLAAQALVRPSYHDPVSTFDTNLMGSINLLDCLRYQDQTRVSVMVTTDKVYCNHETYLPYREIDTLGGHDPYSASKAASEIVIACYRDSYLSGRGIAVASARAGNVIGGGDWSEDRLIPDAIRAWTSENPLIIRDPEAIRPWQHVLEPLSGYLILAEKLWYQPELAGAFNFGPDSHESGTVGHVVRLACDAYGKGAIRHNTARVQLHETKSLALETAKVRRLLGVRPRWNLVESVNRTIAWYKAQQRGVNARTLCLDDISAFEATT